MKKFIFNYFNNLQDKSAEQIKVLGGCKLLLIFFELLVIVWIWKYFEIAHNCKYRHYLKIRGRTTLNNMLLSWFYIHVRQWYHLSIQMNWFWESQCHRKLDGNLLLVIESCQVLEHNRKFSCWKGPAVNLNWCIKFTKGRYIHT